MKNSGNYYSIDDINQFGTGMKKTLDGQHANHEAYPKAFWLYFSVDRIYLPYDEIFTGLNLHILTTDTPNESTRTSVAAISVGALPLNLDVYMKEISDSLQKNEPLDSNRVIDFSKLPTEVSDRIELQRLPKYPIFTPSELKPFANEYTKNKDGDVKKWKYSVPKRITK